MEFELTVLWSIASLMACWCFSVIVRTVSDWIAKKRNRLSPQYSKKSKRIALVVFVLCGLTTALLVYQAVQLESDFDYERTAMTTPIGAVSASVCLFACFLIIWGIIGDRARGRLRCPRCWYDMQGGAGLVCPECGHEAKSAVAFSRSRRPKSVRK